MTTRPILIFPEDILTQPSEPIVSFDGKLLSLVTDLWDTLRSSPGVGLAAPQIGVSKKVAVIDVSKKEKKQGPFVMVNPTLIETQGEQIPREGCLSVPDLLANVRRFEHVKVHFYDELGKEHLLSTSGFEALAIQHEIDHLNGLLFLDRVANIKTDIFRRKLKGS